MWNVRRPDNVTQLIWVSQGKCPGDALGVGGNNVGGEGLIGSGPGTAGLVGGLALGLVIQQLVKEDQESAAAIAGSGLSSVTGTQLINRQAAKVQNGIAGVRSPVLIW